MRKNWINWKRTPCGSCCELVFPILLMLLMLLIRGWLDSEIVEPESMLSSASILFPVSDLNADDDVLDETIPNLYAQYEDFLQILPDYNLDGEDLEILDSEAEFLKM